MPTYRGATPNEFQRMAIEAVCRVLANHGIAQPVFTYVQAPNSYFKGTFDHQRHVGEFEVYDDVIYLDYDGGRSDSQMLQYPSTVAAIDDFAKRADRLLTGGSWYGREDPPFAGWLKVRIRSGWGDVVGRIRRFGRRS